MSATTRYSLTELLNAYENMRIVIPPIQRDYAQGRLNGSDTQVRKEFVKVIVEALSKGVALNLDFVYGKIEKADSRDSYKFIPLDGQQRLTTLFLFHWYLAPNKGMNSEFNSRFVLGSQSRFTYETRFSSVDFFNKLCACDKNQLTIENDSEFSLLIKDSSWFKPSWLSDPTVVGVLNMLDAIHKECKNHTLKYEKLDNITFDFLDLDNFGLTDELYVRMNARGLELSPLEKIKSKIAALKEIKNITNEATAFLRSNFTYKKTNVNFEFFISQLFDNEWSKLIWNQQSLLYSKMDSLAKAYERSFYVLLGQFSVYHNITTGNSEDAASLEEFSGPNLVGVVQTIFLFFGALTKVDSRADVFSYNGPRNMDIPDSHFWERTSIGKLISKLYYTDGLSLTEQVRLFGLLYYFVEDVLVYNPSELVSKISESDFEGYKLWHRVIVNLTENSRIEGDNWKVCINTLYKWISNGYHTDINSNLVKIYQNKEFDGFDNLQVKEEAAKIVLINSSDSLNVLINKLESHGYYRAQVWFFFKYFDIILDGVISGECKFDNERILSIEALFDKMSLVFNSQGVIKELRQEWLFDRAMLTVEDYLFIVGGSGNKRKFLFRDSDRVFSWRRYLSNDNRSKSSDKSKLLSLVSSCPTRTSEGMKDYFQDVVHRFSDTDTNFWYWFVKLPKLFDSCREGIINLGTGCDWGNYSGIRLLSSVNVTSNNVELYSKVAHLLLQERFSSLSGFYYYCDKDCRVIFKEFHIDSCDYPLVFDFSYQFDQGNALNYSRNWVVEFKLRNGSLDISEKIFQTSSVLRPLNIQKRISTGGAISFVGTALVTDLVEDAPKLFHDICVWIDANLGSFVPGTSSATV